MNILISRLLDIERGWAIWPLLKATLAYRKADFQTALRAFEVAMRHDRHRTTENMAFLAKLTLLNNRSPEQYLDLFNRVIAGEFSEDDGSPYAKAFARYWVAHMTDQPDELKLWVDANAQKPKNGWAAFALPLPDKPLQ